MPSFDYTQGAELFAATKRGGRYAPMAYRRFSTAAQAIQYAIEVLPTALLAGAVLQIGEDRYDAGLIRSLYLDRDYPLTRTEQT